MILLVLSLAPVVIIAAYIFYRDKYEREPFGLLLKSVFFGALTTLPILFAEMFVSSLNPFLNQVYKGFYDAFFVAALCEEFFKFLALYLLIWKNPNFNEKFDGIVYAVFISLGFAAVENVLYVYESGYNVAYLRAITAVPAHALFGVAMGFYFGMAKFYPEKRKAFLIRSIIEPMLLHGVYNFIIMAENPRLLGLFVPYVIYIWFIGLKRLKQLSDMSIYKP